MITMTKPAMEVVSSLPTFEEMMSLLEKFKADDEVSYHHVLSVSQFTYRRMCEEYTDAQKVEIENWMRENNVRIAECRVPTLGETYFESVYWPYGLEFPRRSSDRAAGYDFVLPKKVVITDEKPVRIFLGVKCVISPKKKEFLGLYIRSKFTGVVQLLNSVGIIDADYADSPEYNGEIQAIVQCFPGTGPVELDAGECLVQGILQPYDTIDFDIPKKIKRQGGFGSSDRDHTNVIETNVVEADVSKTEEEKE